MWGTEEKGLSKAGYFLGAREGEAGDSLGDTLLLPVPVTFQRPSIVHYRTLDRRHTVWEFGLRLTVSTRTSPLGWTQGPWEVWTVSSADPFPT